MSAPVFKVLDAQRAIRDDTALTSTQVAILWAATLRADNTTGSGKIAGKVRASLGLLARDARLARETVTREVGKPEVRAHFNRVEKPHPRQTDLYFPLVSD